MFSVYKAEHASHAWGPTLKLQMMEEEEEGGGGEAAGGMADGTLYPRFHGVCGCGVTSDGGA